MRLGKGDMRYTIRLLKLRLPKCKTVAEATRCAKFLNNYERRLRKAENEGGVTHVGLP